MIVGEFDSNGRALVRAQVILPRLRRVGDVWFQVDTGADFTCLHRETRPLIGPAMDRLNRDTTVIGRGIGGRSRYFVERAFLVFRDEQRGNEVRQLNLWIAEPEQANDSTASLLGLNMLRHWRMNFDPRNGALQFFP